MKIEQIKKDIEKLDTEELFEIIFKNSRFDFLKEVKACLV